MSLPPSSPISAPSTNPAIASQPWQAFQPMAAIATTPTAAKALGALVPMVTLWVPESLRGLAGCTVYPEALPAHLAELWKTQKALIFGLATGAVVRLIAPLLQDKATDPAVLVVDELGQKVISLCGGHQGGADQLARLIAHQLQAEPILTGAAQRAELPGIDILGQPYGWRKGSGDWTGLSAAIARGEQVQVIQEAGSPLWQQHLPSQHPFIFGWEGESDESAATAAPPPARLWITPQQRQFAPRSVKAQWHPRVLWLGIGCERGTSQAVIDHAITTVLRQNHLAWGAIAGLATIDLKADEVGIIGFCTDHSLPLRCFEAEVLKGIPVPNPSEVVAAEVGTPSVAEAAAIAAAGKVQISAPMPSPMPSLTFSPLRVPKQIFRLEGQPGAVTLAVAQAETEFTARQGQLWLVGTGPGSLDQITPAAKTAIAQADVVIGYALYMSLVQPLLRPGQIVEALPITQERARAERAIALANWGLTVAVISSGDCGIYAMAGLVFEQLRAQAWDGQTPAVQVFPGITALQSAASRVGAPLMHDFCAISLSDLLTPWHVIETRLKAAAAADFVVALYNPKSQTRTEQIAIAQQIFLAHRDAATPVALVRSAYREDEDIILTTLGELLTQPIDMLTTVLIGNQSSRTYAGWMITPRGYLGFDA